MSLNHLPKPGISVIGLGKVGLPMVACFASKGYRVIGVDVNLKKIELLKRGLADVDEPGLASCLSKYGDAIAATDNFTEAVMASEITFIIVPTPTDNITGGFFNEYVLDATSRVGRALVAKSSFHLVVVSSTVLPGSMTREIIPCLERSSGKKCGKDFGVCYSPKFIALGSVIHNFLNPDFALIGEFDKRSGELLSRVLSTVFENNPPIARMNLVNAELTKICVNTFVTMKISYANMVAEICERLPGGDVSVVTSAVGLDTRVSPKYLSGAVGYGGPCFPRDNRALSHVAKSLGVKPTIAEATDVVNSGQVGRLVEILAARIPEGAVVGILGLAYKTGTGCIDDSQGIALAQELTGRGYDLILYDPLAEENAKAALGTGVKFAESAGECVSEADAVVITIPCPEFREIEISDVRVESDKRKVILDCWRILDRDLFSSVSEYLAVGLGDPSEIPHTDTSNESSALDSSAFNQLDLNTGRSNKDREVANTLWNL